MLFVLIYQAVSELKKCSRPVDIVFVIDTSSSIWIIDFEKQIEFIHDVVNMLDVGQAEDQSRVAAITFSNKVTLKLGFLDCKDKACVLQKINEIVHDSGDATRTYLGLDMVSNTVFAKGNGERPNVENVVVVLTDGQTNSGSYDSFRDGGKKETLYKAQVVKEIPSSVVAIGIGNEIDKGELRGIASDPDEDFLIVVSSFDVLNTDNIKNKLLTRTCEVAEIPVKEEPNECRELRADICFVLDESSSIRTNENFQKELRLVEAAIDQMDIGPTKAQIGLLTFSTKPRMQFRLNEYTSKIDMVTALKNIKWHGGDTYTNEAIDMLISRCLNKNFGARSNVPQIAVFVTDGQSTRPSLTKPAVDVLKQTNIITFAIGVGPEYPKFKDELLNMASSASHTFQVEDLDKLVAIRKELVENICQTENNEEKKPGEPSQKEEECKESRADIMFLLDGSTSIQNDATFQKELDFVISVIDGMAIGPTQTQIGVVQFATTPQVEFNLNKYGTKAEVASAVTKIKWMRGDTFLDKAIDKVLEVMTRANGLRNNVPHILCLITDGESTDPAETKKKIALLRASTDFIVIGIGVGPRRSMKELQTLVSDPASLNLFEVENQDALYVLRSKLVTVLCQADRPAEKVCENKIADIIFIADLSTSIGYQAFDQLKDFIKSVVGTFMIGPNNIQIGLITYSNVAKTEFSLNTYRAKDEIMKAIDAVTYTTGDTYTDKALEEMLTKGFTPKAGARASAPKIGVVITDGISREQQKTLDRAKEAKNKGIIMFSIGVGEQIYRDKKELNAIASDPTSKHAFMVEDYGALENIANSLASRACLSDKTNKRTFYNAYETLVDYNTQVLEKKNQENLLDDMGNMLVGNYDHQMKSLDMADKRYDAGDDVRQLKDTINQEELLSLLKKVLDETKRSNK